MFNLGLQNVLVFYLNSSCIINNIPSKTPLFCNNISYKNIYNLFFCKNFLCLSVRVLVLASCWNCPLISSNQGYSLISTENSLQVSKNMSFNCGNNPWSSVGNKWCRVCSPKCVNTMNWFCLASLRSITAFSWKIPKSKSSLKILLELSNFSW